LRELEPESSASASSATSACFVVSPVTRATCIIIAIRVQNVKHFFQKKSKKLESGLYPPQTIVSPRFSLHSCFCAPICYNKEVAPVEPGTLPILLIGGRMNAKAAVRVVCGAYKEKYGGAKTCGPVPF
ncbi:hypothetical protein, partial [uncultured Subdoligranulum sp.]|uniref:hypothetical protein n=1 Tax=uncultured Subdoligranulum sp. TaxID=512298 RepID=UPI0025FC51DF